MNSLRIAIVVAMLSLVASVGSAVAGESSEELPQEGAGEAVVVVKTVGVPEETTDQITALVREHIESALGEEVSIFVEDLSDEAAEPEPLGMNVTLMFNVEDAAEPVSVTTAVSQYLIAAEQSVRHNMSESAGRERVGEHYLIDVAGTIERNGEDDSLLVSCWGTFSETGSSSSEKAGDESAEQEDCGERNELDEEINLDFQASAMFRPGETKVIAGQPQHKLYLTVSVEN